ncbi:MAG: AI-2E family transporter [Candidatus Promineifilaceae bacterium]|nr:AI-2E family transporter [Candidatus Promineifilaceae bacterium]
MKRLAAYAATVGATLAALLILWQLRVVVLLFVLSLFAAAFTRPIVQRLTKDGLPRGIAILLVYLSGIVLGLLALYLLTNGIAGELEVLGTRLTIGYQYVRDVWPERGAFQQVVAARLPPLDVLYEALTAEEGQVLAEAVLDLGADLATLGSGLVVVLVLSIYWSIDREHFERLWLSLLRPEHRMRARESWRATETGVGTYLRAELVQLGSAIVLLGIGYVVMDLPYPTLLALIGGIAWLIPVVGFILTIIPAFLVGLVVSDAVAVLVVLYTVGVLLSLELIVEPRLFGQRRLYSPLLLLVLLVPLAEQFGLLGFLAAPPLAVTIQSLLASLTRRQRLKIEAVYPSARVVELREQFNEVELRSAEVGASPEIANLMERLDDLLDDAAKTFDGNHSLQADRAS